MYQLQKGKIKHKSEKVLTGEAKPCASISYMKGMRKGIRNHNSSSNYNENYARQSESRIKRFFIFIYFL